MKKNDGNQRKQKQKLESHSDETKAKIYAKKENELKNSTKYIKDINNERDKYYIPVCRETGCGGYLSIKFIILNSEIFIDCICSKNKNHQFKNLYFDIFEKFYLKEKFIQKCPNCFNSIENKDKYKCIECDKLYCPSCFLNDIHIKKDWNNLQIITSKCPKDKNELTFYCLNCEQKICPFCLKKFKDEAKNPHKGHEIKSILNEMPSLHQINFLKEKILNKEKAYEKLFKSLDEWQVELHKKIEKIKQNLKSEIRIFKKLFFNYNQEYLNYNYFSDFHGFYADIEDYNNYYIKNFMESKNFEVKSENIFNLLSSINNKPKKTNAYLKRMSKIGDNGILTNINDKFMLLFSDEERCFKIVSIDTFEEISRINFEDELYSLTFFQETKKIYISLLNKKAIRFIDYDSVNNSLKLRKELIEIDDDSEDIFRKCIPIDENNLITTDDENIYLWSKDDSNLDNFIIAKEKSLFCHNLYDGCQVSDKILLFSHCKRLTFFNIETFEVEKIIENIDCKKDKKEKSLIIFNDIVLVNCMKGIAMISIKNKELIQYIQNWENFEVKKMIKSPDNFIYISNSNNCLYKFSFDEYNLKLINKIKIIDKNGDLNDSWSDMEDEISRDKKLSNYNITINGKYIFIYDFDIYTLYDK